MSIAQGMPTQECDLLSMKQPFPVDSAHLRNRPSQKTPPIRPLRGHPHWQMKQRLIEGDGAWTLVQILGERIFWSSLLSSWWLLTGYLWRQACTVISNSLSRRGPDACASVCVCHAPAFKRVSFNFFNGWRVVYGVWMCRMLLGPGGWVWDGYLGCGVMVIRYRLSSMHSLWPEAQLPSQNKQVMDQ